MKNYYSAICLFVLLIVFVGSQAQDLRINKVNNFPDTSLFANSFDADFYFQFTNGTLSPPFTVYFNYSVNGMIQPSPLDSFVYSVSITSEIVKSITVHTNSPVYRKGDNIVVVWPICYQATHSIAYFRTHIFVTDSLNTGISKLTNDEDEKWNVIFDNETHKIKITNSFASDFPINLHIYDNTGKTILSEKMNHEESMPLPQLPSSIYLFELESKHRKTSGRFLQY